MKVKVLYFASARDLTAVNEESVRLPDGTTVAELLKEVVRAHPGLKRLEPSIRVSVNFQLVDGASTLCDGDEVGILPPVAGG